LLQIFVFSFFYSLVRRAINVQSNNKQSKLMMFQEYRRRCRHILSMLCSNSYSFLVRPAAFVLVAAAVVAVVVEEAIVEDDPWVPLPEKSD
jgi:hypothetical protein